MTITEKADELYSIPEYLSSEEAERESALQTDAFAKGAIWMLNKVCEWYAKKLNGITFSDVEENVQELRDLMNK